MILVSVYLVLKVSIGHNMDVPISKIYAINQGSISLSTRQLKYGRHLARLRRRRAHASTSNTASHDNHEKINSWVSFSFLYEYGAPLGGPSSTIIQITKVNPETLYVGPLPCTFSRQWAFVLVMVTLLSAATHGPC